MSEQEDFNRLGSSVRLGHLHIPKSAGASLNNTIFRVLGIEPFYVAHLIARGEDDSVAKKKPARTIVEGKLEHILARNMPFVAGHLKYHELKRLNRNFVFTVLRDPRKRVISLYTYARSRASSEKVIRRRPGLAKYIDMDFYEFMEQRKPEIEGADFLLGDLPRFWKLREREFPEDEIDEVIRHGLGRFDAVYACSNQEVLDDLHARGLLPKATEQWRNMSRDEEWFKNIGSSGRFLETLDRATWLDIRVYSIARQMFPETVVSPLANDDELLVELGRRFGASFQA